MTDIAGPCRKVFDRGLRAGEPDDFLGKREDRLALPVADVVGAGHVVRAARIGEGSDDVGHMDEVARLTAVAMDADRFVAESLGDEDRDGGGVGGAWILPRAEDVEEAQARRAEAVGLAVLCEQLFAGEFGLGVGRFRLGRHRLQLRYRRVVAVDGGGGRQDDLTGAGGQGGIQHPTGAFGVQFRAFGRLGDGFRHGDHRGQVVDLRGAGDRLPQGRLIKDRAL